MSQSGFRRSGNSIACRNQCIGAAPAEGDAAMLLLGSAAMHVQQSAQERLLTVSLDAVLVQPLFHD